MDHSTYTNKYYINILEEELLEPNKSD